MSNVKVWRYSWPNENHEGWGIVLIDESGCFAAITDWGNFVHRWNVSGLAEGETMRTFFLRADADYVVRKCMGGDVEEYDPTETAKAVRAAIEALESANEHSSELELLEMSDLDTIESFAVWAGETGLEDAFYSLQRSRPRHEAANFEKHVFPKLQAAIRAEIAAEERRI